MYISPIVVLFSVIGILVLYYYFSRSQENYTHQDHPVLNQIRENFKLIKKEYGEIPLREGGSSYTENKSAITLCLTDPKTKRFYDMNTLMYVALHELAHTVTKSSGDDSHGDEFKKNFIILLKRADALGLYNSSQPIPLTYCGIKND